MVSADAVDTWLTIADVVLAAGVTELLVVVVVFWLVARRTSVGAGAAEDRGEAESAQRRAARASGSPLPASHTAPASPHPDVDDDIDLVGYPFSLGEFVDPDGMCAWCFEPRSKCKHQPREFFVST